MAKKQRKFIDDGWAIWTDGDDTCTIYLQDWLNPKGKSYVDLAIRIRNVKADTRMRVYIPFSVSREEIDDVSLLFNDTKILQAVFGSACIIDYKKNDFTSEIAYLGKTVDVVHVSTLEYQLTSLSDGTLIDIDFEAIQPFIDNDDAYLIWRMPHKSLDKLFKSRVGAGNWATQLRDLITSPMLSEKHGYSVRINEPRVLPEEITRIGAFHRQKLKKAVITLSVAEDYELNDAGCYRIRRLEERLYKDYLPKDYSYEDVITYQWNQSRDDNQQGQFDFYYNLTKDSVSKSSMFLYMVLLFAIAVVGDIFAEIVKALLKIF